MNDFWIKYEGFLGKGWAFPPAFDRDEQIPAMVTSHDDIRESLYILLTTIPGERIMLPDYGCKIHEHVFDVIGETLFTHLRELIDHAILHYEPRIALEDVLFNADDEIGGKLLITVVYRVLQTNTRSNLVIPYYLNEGTLVPLLEAS
jgi:uncharacterized protein